jgi:hypothetical protein
MWCSVDLVLTYVSEESIASILRVATCSGWFLDSGFFYPEDGGNTFLRNVGSRKIFTEFT